LIGPPIQASDTSSLSPVRQKASEAVSLKRASLTVLQAAEKVNKAEKGQPRLTLRLFCWRLKRNQKFPVSGWLLFAAALFLFTSIICQEHYPAYTFQ